MTAHVFHITTQITQHQLIGAQRVAMAQEERILALFRSRPYDMLSPRQVMRALQRIATEHGGPDAPMLNSVRRAMSNLTRDGALIHTTCTVDGPYGRPETQWQLAQGNTNG